MCLVAPATRTNAHVGPDTTSLRSRSLHEADPPTPAKPALRTASGLYLLHQHRRAWPAADAEKQLSAPGSVRVPTYTGQLVVPVCCVRVRHGAAVGCSQLQSTRSSKELVEKGGRRKEQCALLSVHASTVVLQKTYRWAKVRAREGGLVVATPRRQSPHILLYCTSEAGSRGIQAGYVLSPRLAQATLLSRS